MKWFRVSAGSPEQLFHLVKNSDTVSLTNGWGVVYDFFTSTGTLNGNDGYSVRYPRTDYNYNVGLFAGVVVGGPISPGEFGSVQVWGYHEKIIVCGASGFGGFVGASIAFDQNSVAQKYLRVVSATTEWTMGLFGFVNIPAVAGANHCANCVVPVDGVIPDLSTTYGTLTTIFTHIPTTNPGFGYLKGFIRAL